MHRGKHGGQPGGGAAQPHDEGDELAVQQATVERMEQQLRDLRVAASKVKLEASAVALLSGVLREQETKLQAARGVLHLLLRVRAEGSDEPARFRQPGAVLGESARVLLPGTVLGESARDLLPGTVGRARDCRYWCGGGVRGGACKGEAGAQWGRGAGLQG